jgi:hypothetical protein
MAGATQYPGPLSLTDAKTKLNVSRLTEDAFHREGTRANVEYRDLGLAAATGGRIGAKHIRAIKPFVTVTLLSRPGLALAGQQACHTTSLASPMILR